MQLNQLTFTRFIAAIAIVVFHFGQNLSIFNNEYLKIIIGQANLGVSYFFVLSGFVMIIAYNNFNKLNYFQFIKNRIARIVPLYLIALFLFIITILPVFKINFDLLYSFFLVQAWIPNKATTLNYPGWSLSVEMFFYAIFPLLLNFIYKNGKIKSIFIVVLIIWLLSQVVYNVYNKEFEFCSYFPLLHLNQFLIGNFFGILFLKNKEKKQQYSFFYLIFFIGLLVLILFNNKYLLLHNGGLAFIFGAIIYFLSKTENRIVNFVSTKPFLILGEISYGIYILQVPIWSILSEYRLKKYFGFYVENECYHFGFKLFLLIIISTFFYYLIEMPLRRKIKKLNF